MLHIIKLAVGAKEISHLQEWQDHRAKVDAPLRHRTRNFPRRASEIVGAGSIYWVVGGLVQVRQRILDVIEDRRPDGAACAALVLDRTLVPVAGRPMKAFQGWRYLPHADAPPDLDSADLADGERDLPPELARALRALCLL